MKKKRVSPGTLTVKQTVGEKFFLNGFMPYLWIALLGFAIYLQSLFFNFIYFDDNLLILDQQYFIKDIANIFKAFGRDVFGNYNTIYYRPIYNISLILNGVIGGVQPFIYHLTNCLLHLSVSCLVFLLFLKLKYERFPALLFALLFTVLPVLTQNVVWIPGRNDMLLFLFILAALISFINYLEKKHWYDFFLHALCFGLAMFTKEITVALPILCLYYFLFIHKQKLFSKTTLRFVITWIALFLLWFVLKTIALAHPIQVTIPQLFKSVFSGLPAIIPYLGKIFLPFNLAVLPVMQDTTFVYGIIVILLLLCAVLFTKKIRQPFLWLGLLWFCLFLVPSFISPDVPSLIHYREDRLYVPVLGLFILLLETAPVITLIKKPKLALPIFIALLCAYSVITIVHSTRFKERLVFWESAVKQAPHSPLAHRNLGAMYYFDGNAAAAETEYKMALTLNPAEPMAHSNLGAIYMERNLLTEAESEFKAELQINPQFDRALFNLGLLYYQKKNYADAIRYWKEATRVNDMKLDAFYGLALAYHDLGDETQAQHYLEEYKKRGGKVNQ